MTIPDILSATVPRQWRRPAVILLPLVVAAALAVTGAFGTYVSMTLPLRLLHFVGVAISIYAIVFALCEIVRRFWFGDALPFWAMLAIGSITAPAGGWIVLEALGLSAPRALSHVTYPELTTQVLLSNLAIGSLGWTLLGQSRTGSAACEALKQPRSNSDQALRAKLPIGIRNATILALSAEDHYVRVRTDRGEALILMNLAAAIAALGEEAGVRVHRSHWVSRQLAEKASMRGCRRGVRVNDDTMLPVSRSGRKLLNEVWTGY
ncbi:LytTR family DNA-binding domain-containing protein [Rhizobium calliandrae]|uniref:LytTR family DNA-binding domain-containing protein n=1 Tax=Rhizobium calliandrae TaxID=1312182 RepID=A0ABT7KKB2_9HYPH|nr:LytTR family DNA-binding domain-containing protein [Rhizobium calliandrae]MDL2409074.1 LytTR family DNA-binding domain-containing protein [Rhizobium calliandrae]